MSIKKPSETLILQGFCLFYADVQKMPAAGLEPARAYTQQILSLHRLPFRHAGVHSNKWYNIILVARMQQENRVICNVLYCRKNDEENAVTTIQNGETRGFFID